MAVESVCRRLAFLLGEIKVGNISYWDITW